MAVPRDAGAVLQGSGGGSAAGSRPAELASRGGDRDRCDAWSRQGVWIKALGSYEAEGIEDEVRLGPRCHGLLHSKLLKSSSV